MLKKNTRKRLLAGALATVMMLTMCPSWALADDDGITPLPLVDENRPVAESAPVEADTTETPAVPTPSEPEAKPAEDQNTDRLRPTTAQTAVRTARSLAIAPIPPFPKIRKTILRIMMQ